MKRFLTATVFLCVLSSAAVAAPALSLQTWKAEPVQFSIAAGTESAGVDGVVSRPRRAPKRFNLVGMTWSDRGAEPRIAVRTRGDRGDWSRWAPLNAHAEDGPDPGTEDGARGASAPTWVGEADWVQYRLSERPRGLRIHFVNVRGTATPADRARTAIRRVASAGVASIARVLGAGGATAAEPAPPVVPRSGWNAEKCPPRAEPDFGEVRAAFVHHTVNANDYSREEAPSVVLGICLFHRNTNGWNDIGYNFLVDRFGTLYEGRAGGLDQAVVGAQAQGYNAQSTGIANLGTFSSFRQSAEALRAMAQLIRWKLPLHGVPTAGSTTLVSAGGSSNRFAAGQVVKVPRVPGHRDTGATSCPGDALYAQLPELRRLIGHVGPAGVATSLLARAAARTVRFGATTEVTGRLTVAGGAPIGHQRVQVQAFIGRRWRTVAAPLTDAHGGLSAIVKPMRNRRLRARFGGLGDLRPATSPTFVVAVRPILSLSRTARLASAGARYVIRGRVRPRKARVYQVLQQKRGWRFRTVGTRAIRTRRDGRFRGYFVPVRAGTYRFYVVARRDSQTARAATAKVRLRVGRLRGGGASP